MTTNTTKRHNLVAKLNRAYARRDAHQELCTEWDYEGSGCLECADLSNEVKKLRRELRELDGCVGQP